jgi:DNA-binding response OmpR family regulator
MSKTAENIIKRLNEIDRVYFSKDEIIRIINVVTSIHNRPPITLDNITIIPESYKVLLGDKTVILCKKEFEILYKLMENSERVFNRHEILNDIWGEDVIVLERTVDVHICRINKKMGKQIIQTMKGIGYKCCL